MAFFFDLARGLKRVTSGVLLEMHTLIAAPVYLFVILSWIFLARGRIQVFPRFRRQFLLYLGTWFRVGRSLA